MKRKPKQQQPMTQKAKRLAAFMTLTLGDQQRIDRGSLMRSFKQTPEQLEQIEREIAEARKA